MMFTDHGEYFKDNRTGVDYLKGAGRYIVNNQTGAELSAEWKLTNSPALRGSELMSFFKCKEVWSGWELGRRWENVYYWGIEFIDPSMNFFIYYHRVGLIHGH